MNITCKICPHACELHEGEVGFCRARENVGGKIRLRNYGYLSALALDPIEKKPLRHFHPGSHILSIGGYGCNLRCPFCQNHEISMVEQPAYGKFFTPVELINLALQERNRGNIGIAYTYNEPLISFEFIRDCMILAREQGLYNVLVTNGYVNQEALEELLLYTDAMNIDLKSFRPDFYHTIGGDLDIVKENIALAANHTHVEVTTLLIPGVHTLEELKEEARWIASVDPKIPLHLTRFFPYYHMADRPPTSLSLIREACHITSTYLSYVYAGNCRI